MTYWIFVALVLLGVAIALVLPNYRLKKALEAPFPDEWVSIVETNIGVYRSLPKALRLTAISITPSGSTSKFEILLARSIMPAQVPNIDRPFLARFPISFTRL